MSELHLVRRTLKPLAAVECLRAQTADTTTGSGQSLKLDSGLASSGLTPCDGSRPAQLRYMRQRTRRPPPLKGRPTSQQSERAQCARR